MFGKNYSVSKTNYFLEKYLVQKKLKIQFVIFLDIFNCSFRVIGNY
jgi:hypothetical protein